MNIKRIIAQLEAATEPSRDLDEYIALLIGWTRDTRLSVIDSIWWCPPDSNVWQIGFPLFTVSMDAAVSAIPAGLFWLAGYGRNREDEPDYGCQVILAGGGVECGETNVNLAIAICTAALKARDVLAGVGK